MLRTLSTSLHYYVSESRPQVWIGKRSPLDVPSISLRDSINFRAPPEHHQSYDLVWLVEDDLGTLVPGQFELMLDESLRLLRKTGKLIVRFTQSPTCSVIALKHFLARRYNIRVSVASEALEAGRLHIVFVVERMDLHRYQRQDWAFAVLTQGKRVENLRAFFQSIRRLDPEREHEILVCGPKLPELEHFGLSYVEGQYREELAEICTKKNDIAQQTDKTNLLIAHDRYRLQDDYLNGFARYGYDFDFVTIPQWYESGEPFPAYCAMSENDLSWSTALHCTNYQALLPIQYLNGGLLIAKTMTLRDIPFNPLLFWNQAEDVELARVFRSQGIPPRINPYCSAITMGITPAYTQSIIPFRGQELRGQRAALFERLSWRMRKLQNKVRNGARKLLWRDRTT